MQSLTTNSQPRRSSGPAIPFARFLVTVIVSLVLLAAAAAIAAEPTDISWPRVFEKDGKKLTVYQPQVDSWKDYTTLHFRCAISIEGVLKDEKFGVAEGDAQTIVDHETRMVAITPQKRELRFAKTSDADLALLRAAVEQLNPSSNVTILSLDRVLAYLDPTKTPVQRTVEVNLDPPTIFHANTPAILVNVVGKPMLKPVEANRADLQFVINTNWDLLFDVATKRYYLLNGENWLTTEDVLKGPWTAAATLPASISTLPATENWEEARKQIPGKPAAVIPKVFASTQPAELIVTEGEPQFAPIQGTRLTHVTNTESVLFRNIGDAKYYLLVAGRWFSAASLDGPWASASKNLPAEFASIPDDDSAAFVKASVPGTREAQDAVLLASIPNTTVVDLKEKPVEVTYNGTPKFTVIEGTQVQSAANSPFSVFLVNGTYYCCHQGAWFTAASPNGPWAFASSVPPAIYSIPPSSPSYNVTYVTVQSSTPSTVTYSQTSGYSGEYVATTGVLMFGAGMLVGAAIANDDDYYHYPVYPAYYSYGCGAAYHYGYGGYYAGGAAHYGPYGGAGCAAAYNPATGTYARGSYAYGPYGSSATRAAYNPYTGAAAWGQQVNTAYGSAGRGAAYNPYTGTSARGAYASGQYGSAGFAQAYNPRTGAYAGGAAVETDRGAAAAGRAYNPETGRGAAGGAVSGDYGSAGAVRTAQGGAAAAWDTENSQGAAAKTRSGDVYASNGDSVYKKDSSGGWSTNSGDGWESASKPEASAAQQERASSAQESRSSAQSAQQERTSSAQQQRSSAAGSSSQSMEAQAQSRERGNQQAERSRQYKSSGTTPQRSRSSGGGRSGGGGRR